MFIKLYKALWLTAWDILMPSVQFCSSVLRVNCIDKCGTKNLIL